MMEKSIKYLKESKKAILFVTAVFFLSAIFGILNADILEEIITPLIKDLIDKTEDLGLIGLIIFIFLNNSLTSFIGIILGIFLGIIPIISIITNGVVLGFVLEKVSKTSIMGLWRLFPHGIFELPAVFISLGLGVKLGVDITRNYMFKNKKSRLKQIFGAISMILGIIGIGVLRLATNVSSTPLVFAGLFFILGILFLTPFILLFFITDKKIRGYNTLKIKHSLKIFVYIVIPLLVIAALIEGILIVVLP